jgi:hypothetical protein
MTIKEILQRPNKANIKNFQGRIATGTAPKDPTPHQQRFGEHVQTIFVDDSAGDQIEVRLMRTSQHMDSTVAGHAVVFEAGEDKDGMPTGLRVEKWEGKNGQMCILSVDSKHGARTYVTDRIPPVSEATATAPQEVKPLPGSATGVRYDQAPGGYPADKMAARLEWCWKKIDYMEDEGLRQKMATTLFIEMSRHGVEPPPIVEPTCHEIQPPEPVQADAVDEPRPCEDCGEDLGHGPGPKCGACTINSMRSKAAPEVTPEVQHEETPGVAPEPTPGEEACGLYDPVLSPEFIELRGLAIEKFGGSVWMEGFKMIYEAHEGSTIDACEQILGDTKSFKELLFDIAKDQGELTYTLI